MMKKILIPLLLLPLFMNAQEDNKTAQKKGVDTKKYVPKGLSIGADAPLIKGTSINGKSINSDALLKEKTVVVLFYRGKWCPYCSKHLSNLNDSIQYIEGKGAAVLVVGPETFDNTEKTVDKVGEGFVLIPDTTMDIMKSYDVLFNVTGKYQTKIKTFLMTDIAKNNGQEEASLPVPATYIIGKDGKIKWRHFDYDYTKRASAKEIMDNL